MDWKTLGTAVADVAPALGTLLGGPLGGVAGSAIAAVFGTEEDPGAVAEAIRHDPAAAVKLAEVEAQLEARKAELAADLQKALIAERTAKAAEVTARAAQVNETMRAEYQAAVAGAGVFRTGWRPFIGWIFGAAIGWLLGCIGWLLLEDPAQVGPAVEGIAALNMVFVTMLAVLGVTVRARSADKATAADPSRLTLLGAAAKRLAGGR